MSYVRVIPRDLFNEASLLKCYGQIYLNLENLPGHDAVLIERQSAPDEPFLIVWDPNDGSISLSNVQLEIDGRAVMLKRPMNSRDPYPLYLIGYVDGDYGDDFEEIAVFDDDGSFSDDMIALLTKEGKPE